jgi:hypothetical protein
MVTSSGVAILGKGTAATAVSKVAIDVVPKKFVTCNSAVYVPPGTRSVYGTKRLSVQVLILLAVSTSQISILDTSCVLVILQTYVRALPPPPVDLNASKLRGVHVPTLTTPVIEAFTDG